MGGDYVGGAEGRLIGGGTCPRTIILVPLLLISVPLKEMLGDWTGQYDSKSPYKGAGVGGSVAVLPHLIEMMRDFRLA